MCKKIIELYDKETKIVPTSFNEKNITCRAQNFICIFINCYSIIESKLEKLCINNINKT